jgi:hypothetical protein
MQPVAHEPLQGILLFVSDIKVPCTLDVLRLIANTAARLQPRHENPALLCDSAEEWTVKIEMLGKVNPNTHIGKSRQRWKIVGS